MRESVPFPHSFPLNILAKGCVHEKCRSSSQHYVCTKHIKPRKQCHKMTPAGLEPAIPGSVGRCLIHWATGPINNGEMLRNSPNRFGSKRNLSAHGPRCEQTTMQRDSDSRPSKNDFIRRHPKDSKPKIMKMLDEASDSVTEWLR